jgi:hypothetical protein
MEKTWHARFYGKREVPISSQRPGWIAGRPELYDFQPTLTDLFAFDR